MYELRDQITQKYNLQLIVHTNPDGIAHGINPFTHGSAIHTDVMKTQGLKQALDLHGFDAAFGGARRDEEKSPRQGARVLVPQRAAPLGPEEPAAGALVALQHPHAPGREHARVPAVELDRARHLALHLSARTSRSCRSTSRPSGRWSIATAR